MFLPCLIFWRVITIKKKESPEVFSTPLKIPFFLFFFSMKCLLCNMTITLPLEDSAVCQYSVWYWITPEQTQKEKTHNSYLLISCLSERSNSLCIWELITPKSTEPKPMNEERALQSSPARHRIITEEEGRWTRTVCTHPFPRIYAVLLSLANSFLSSQLQSTTNNKQALEN